MDSTSNDRVELENQINLHDEYVKTALDAIVQNTEQSYPQFMNNFTQLLNDTVRIPNLNLSSQESHSANLTPVNGRIEEHSVNDLAHRTNQSVLPSDGENDVGKDQEIGLEEEVLGDGDRPPSVLLRESSLTGNTVKLDNFLDDDNASDSDDSVPLEEGEWIELGGYQASFSPRNAEEGCLPMVKRDSTGAVIPIDPSAEESTSSQCACPEQLELFPGEIEDIPTSPRENELQNVTQLDITTTRRESKVQNSCDESQEISGDDVQPFSLDADFDYDNVILTSKYTPTMSSDGIAQQLIDVHLS